MNVPQFCEYWAKGIESGEGMPYKQHKSCNVFVRERTIYSYGEHFPMAYIVAPNVVWLNGDRYSPTTDRHQRALRSVLAWRKSVQVVIVPDNALGAAGIDYRTIQPVDVHAESFEYTLHSGANAPGGMSTETTNQHNIDVTAAYGGDVSNWHAPPWQQYAMAVGWMDSEAGRQVVIYDYDNGEYRWHTSRHWLGDSVFTAERSAGWTPEKGTIRERVYFISSFDRQERIALYFLSQLPGPVSTVDQAIESLAPDSVKTARELGRDVKRQGDMFAIPMDATTRELRKYGATFAKRHVKIELNRYASEQVAIRTALETVKPTMPQYPQRKYLGDFPGNGTMYDREAFDLWYKQWQADCDSWADELVARYQAAFPQLPELTRWSWQSALGFKPTVWQKTRDVDATALMGTAHTASKVATLPNGLQFARGIMYHDPAIIGERRRPDHARRALGKQWHLVARNTVPVSGR